MHPLVIPGRRMQQDVTLSSWPATMSVSRWCREYAMTMYKSHVSTAPLTRARLLLHMAVLCVSLSQHHSLIRWVHMWVFISFIIFTVTEAYWLHLLLPKGAIVFFNYSSIYDCQRLDYRWIQTGVVEAESYINTLSWNVEGTRLLTAGEVLQLWSAPVPKVTPPEDGMYYCWLLWGLHHI